VVGFVIHDDRVSVLRHGPLSVVVVRAVTCSSDELRRVRRDLLSLFFRSPHSEVILIHLCE